MTWEKIKRNYYDCLDYDHAEEAYCEELNPKPPFKSPWAIDYDNGVLQEFERVGDKITMSLTADVDGLDEYCWVFDITHMTLSNVRRIEEYFNEMLGNLIAALETNY